MEPRDDDVELEPPLEWPMTLQLGCTCLSMLIATAVAVAVVYGLMWLLGRAGIGG